MSIILIISFFSFCKQARRGRGRSENKMRKGGGKRKRKRRRIGNIHSNNQEHRSRKRKKTTISKTTTTTQVNDGIITNVDVMNACRYFTEDEKKILTTQDIFALHNDLSYMREFKSSTKNLVVNHRNEDPDHSSTSRTDKTFGESQVVEKQVRKLITSIDIEGDKRLLQNVTIPFPQRVGLIINLAGRYDKDGNKLQKRKKAKALTIVYLTSYSQEEIKKIFNSKDRVPCPILRPYCGFLVPIYSITNFKNEEIAKTAFYCFKEHTRGPFSRLYCGLTLYKFIKERWNTQLKQEFVTTFPSETIQGLLKYAKRKRKSFTK
ncbi:MAG: hypothetical protein ACTSUE_13890 [Promethearchaeota archaeon]